MRRQDVVRSTSSLVLAGTLTLLSPMAAGAATQTVEAGSGGFVFDPKTRTVARGDRVVWVNVSGFDHDVTSSLPGYVRAAGRLGVGEQFGRTFSSAGRFGYFCDLHAGMSGTIVVPISVSLSGGLFTIRVASATTPSSSKWRNRIQVRRPGSTSWRTIATTTARSVTFDPGPRGTYRFRSAVRNRVTGAISGFSPVVSKVY
jgi:plastocyanin